MNYLRPEHIFTPRPWRQFFNISCIFGLGLFSLVFTAAFIDLTKEALFYWSIAGFSRMGPFLAVGLCGGALAACIFGIRSRLRDNQRLRRMERLASYMSLHRGRCPFHELAAMWGFSVDKSFFAELYTMQKKGLLENMVIDTKKELLYFSFEAPRTEPAADTLAGLNEAEREAAPVLERLRGVNSRLLTAEDTALLQRLLDDTEAVLANTRKDARDVPAAVQFLHRFLPMGEKLVTRLPDIPAGHMQLRGQIIQALDNLHTAFGNKLQQLYENDRMEAEAEAAVLEQLLRSNGLIDSEKNQLSPPF